MPVPIILIAVDNEAEQNLLKGFLEKFDYDAQSVSSGEEAIAALAVGTYAAILMDVALQGINGIECTRRIRRLELDLGRRTPVILSITRTDRSDRDQSSASGVDGYIVKPFNTERVRRVLLRYVYDANKPNLKTLRAFRLPPDDSEIELSA